MNKRLLLVVVALLLFTTGCEDNKERKKDAEHFIKFSGRTMGTTYTLQYFDPEEINYQKSVDSILEAFNQSLSTYIPSSVISQFNRLGADTMMEVDYWFYKVLTRSKEIYETTGGYFNPAVMPLVNYYGFGSDEHRIRSIDSTIVDSLLQLLKLESVRVTKVVTPSDSSYFSEKLNKDIQLDFSAIAKGYGVDVLITYLNSKGIENAYVEIGGELGTIGLFENDPWKIGVEKPVEDDPEKREIYAIVKVSNQSVATSGNYRNYRKLDGKRIVHTINPLTGYPEENDLLSATVIAKDCMTADAYATAFMAMGKSRSEKVVRSDDQLSAFLIYLDRKGEIKYETLGKFGDLIIQKPAS